MKRYPYYIFEIIIKKKQLIIWLNFYPIQRHWDFILIMIKTKYMLKYWKMEPLRLKLISINLLRYNQ